MKKIFLVALGTLMMGPFMSCERDESLDPRPVIDQGQYARLDITSKVLNIDDDNSYFGGILTNPSGKIVTYNLYVKRRNGLGFVTEFAPLKTVTSFPYDLHITRNDIATGLGLQSSDLQFGDEYYFYAESFDAAGTKANFYSLSTSPQSVASMKQGYRFRTTMQNTDFFSNPTNISEYDNYVNP